MIERYFSFWWLQAAGWSAFYVLILAAAAPFLNEPGVVVDTTLFVASLFVASCLLRPICRSLAQRNLPWIAIEARAFGWAVLTGGFAALLVDFVEAGRKLSWSGWLLNWLQYAVVLFLWCSLYISIKLWQRAAHERERLACAESEARAARLSALRYQLNPHFLLNSLNAVSTLVLEGDAPAATRMLSQIGELLRETLRHDFTAETPLNDEIAFAERYLAIERTRLGERLQVDIKIQPDTIEAFVPSLLLQPLVENAVRHGVAPRIEGGRIEIRADRNADRLSIVIRNPAGSERNETGVGLANTEARLKAMYGAEYRLSHHSVGGDFVVTVELPYRPKEAAACVS